MTGLLGDANSEPFVRLFAEKDIADKFVRVPGLTRVNVKIVDEAQDRVTDINFPGLQVTGDHLARLYAAVDALAEDTQWFVLSGSVPQASGTRLCRVGGPAEAPRKTVVLDASRPPFAAAIPSAPDIIKPNIEELQELVGGRLSGHAEVVEPLARWLRADRPGRRLDGERGRRFRERRASWRPPKITVKSTVGAGDAMVAGIVTGALRG